MKNVVNKLKNLSLKTRNFAIGAGVVAGSVVNVVSAHAEGLDPAITAGFTSAGTNVALIIGAGITASVGVIGLAGGGKAGLKWIKGVFSRAS